MGDAFAGLPDWQPQIVRRAGELKAELGRLARDDAAVRQAIDAAVAPAESAIPALLDALIRDQHWRAAHFRVAGDDINYRRFFNINDLAGLRMELPDLFDHAHALVLRLLERGHARRAPHRPYRRAPRPEGVSGTAAPPGRAPVLSRRREDPRSITNRLREDWPVEGTTGYDFTNLALALLSTPQRRTG